MKYLICNLKAHKNYSEMQEYKLNIANINSSNINLIIAPSLIYLPLFQESKYTLCAQNLSLHDNLSLTGDITINQLKSLNVKYAIIGHQERRKYYQEKENEIIIKINNALNNQLKVIYCIGETKEELLRKVEYQVLERKIARVFNNIPETEFKNIILAYEPDYMIGGFSPISINKLIEHIKFIKKIINSYYHGNIKIIYGGNINPKNIADFNKIPELDGFIIGASSKDPETLNQIIKEIT